MNPRTAKLTRFVQEFSTPGRLLILEAFLLSSGLLAPLEQLGVIPVLESPNPHHPELASAEHERWWNENPEARIAYHTAYNARYRSLMLLHLGETIAPERKMGEIEQ